MILPGFVLSIRTLHLREHDHCPSLQNDAHVGSKQKKSFFYSIFAHRVSKRKLSEIVKRISFCLYALIDIDLLTLHVLERYWLISPSRIDPFFIL